MSQESQSIARRRARSEILHELGLEFKPKDSTIKISEKLYNAIVDSAFDKGNYRESSLKDSQCVELLTEHRL